jgi:hypothetical protein
VSRAFLFWRDERKISKIDDKGESKKKEDAVFIFTKHRQDEDRILLLIGSSRSFILRTVKIRGDVTIFTDRREDHDLTSEDHDLTSTYAAWYK